jgi:hypothetical protein
VSHVTSKLVFQQDRSHLPDLIHLGFISISLQVDFLEDAFFSQDMMASPDSLLEAQILQETAQFIKPNIRIRRSAQNLSQKFIVFAHPGERLLDHRRHDLADAALQLAVVSDR